jgi:iron complex outermembrane receptor protein
MNQPKLTPIAMAAILVGLASLSAQAQTAPDANADKKKAEEAQPAQLDTVIVTTNRREQLSQKVAGVVQSFNAEQLRKDGVTELRNLQTSVPGLSIANQEGNVEIFIRGVGSANNTELGDPGAAPHLNGTYIPRPRGLGTMFYDLERVEVNKGPQGTLYGRNAMAGTLNIITAKPRFDRVGGYVQAGVGVRDQAEAEGAVNIPLGNDLGVRLAGFATKKDAGFVNASPDPAAAKLKPAGLEENYGGRLSVLWSPSENLNVSVVADVGKETGTGYPGSNISEAVLKTGLRPEQMDLRKVIYRAVQGDMTNELSGIQAKLEYDFGGWSAELSGSFRKVDFEQTNAASDGIAYPGRDYAQTQWDNHSNTYWQTKSDSSIYELRFFSTDKKAPLRWTAGVFSFDEKQQVGFLSVADRGYCCYSGTEFTMPDVRGKSTAVYGDATWDIAQDSRVIFGLRHTDESKYRWGIGGNLALVLKTGKDACCVASRFGTEGFKPNLLNRPVFDLSKVKTDAQIAQFLIDSIRTPGARDTVIAQIGPIAKGVNANGSCFLRPDINNGWVSTCPSGMNGGFYVDPNDPGNSRVGLSIPSQQVGSSAFKYQDFRLGYELDLGKTAMVYAKVSTGHKSGGFNDSFSGSGIPETFSPEKAVVYEVGSRNAFDFNGKRAIFNATAFYYDYSNQVFQDLACLGVDTATPPKCNSYALVNRNIGTSRIAGLELETKFALMDGLNLDLNATLLDTQITKGQIADARGIDYGNGGKAPLINLKGNKLPLASDVNLAARLTHSFALGGGKLDWQALVNYRSDYYLTQFNELPVEVGGKTLSALAAGFPDKQKGYATLNIGVGYGQGNWRVEAFGTNVTNEQASQKAIVGPNLDIRFLNDARTYGVRGRMSF